MGGKTIERTFRTSAMSQKRTRADEPELRSMSRDIISRHDDLNKLLRRRGWPRSGSRSEARRLLRTHLNQVVAATRGA